MILWFYKFLILKLQILRRTHVNIMIVWFRHIYHNLSSFLIRSDTVHFSNLHYFPFELFFFFLLLGALILLIVLIELDILEYAYERIGISQRYIFSLLLLTLLGSSINIPIAQLPEQEVVSGTTITVFGIPYIIPMVVDWPGTVIAVNLGGAVIPTLLSLYLLVKHRLYARGLMGIAIVVA